MLLSSTVQITIRASTTLDTVRVNYPAVVLADFTQIFVAKMIQKLNFNYEIISVIWILTDILPSVNMDSVNMLSTVKKHLDFSQQWNRSKDYSTKRKVSNCCRLQFLWSFIRYKLYLISMSDSNMTKGINYVKYMMLRGFNDGKITLRKHQKGWINSDSRIYEPL